MDLDTTTTTTTPIDHSNRTTNNFKNSPNQHHQNQHHHHNQHHQHQPHYRPTSPKTIQPSLSSPPVTITNKPRSHSTSQLHQLQQQSQSSSQSFTSPSSPGSLSSTIITPTTTTTLSQSPSQNDDLSSSTEIHQDENQLNSNIFENLGFVIDITINLKRKMELVKIIKKNGGKSCYSCTKATHLITTKQGYIEKTQKVQQAISLNIPILVKEYVHYCAFKKELLPVETYLVSSLISNTSSLSLSQELEQTKTNDEDHNENNEIILTPLDISGTTSTISTVVTNDIPLANSIRDTLLTANSSNIENTLPTATTSTTTKDSNVIINNLNDSTLKSDHLNKIITEESKQSQSQSQQQQSHLSSIDSNTKTIEDSNYISTIPSNTLANTLIDKVDLDDKLIQQSSSSQPLQSSSSLTISNNNQIITPVSILKNPNNKNLNNNVDEAEENLRNEQKEKKKKFSQKKNHLLNLKKSYQDPLNVTQSRPRKSSGGATTLMEAISDQVNYISNLDNFKYYARGSQMALAANGPIVTTNNINNNNNKFIRLNEYNAEEEFEDLEELEDGFEDLEEEDEEDEDYYEEDEDDDEEDDDEDLSDEYFDEEDLSDEDVSYSSKINNKKEFEHHQKQQRQKIQQLQKQLENLVLNNNSSSQNVRKLRSYSRDYIDNNIVKNYLSNTPTIDQQNLQSSINSASTPSSPSGRHGTIQKSTSLDKLLHSPKKRSLVNQQQQQQQQDSSVNNNLLNSLNKVKDEPIIPSSPSTLTTSSTILPSSPKQQSQIENKNNLIKNKKKKPFLPPLSTLVHILVTFIILSAFFMSLPNTNNV